MANQAHVKVAGVYRKALHVHVKAGGAWRDCKEVWVRVSGTWRKVFSLFNVGTGVSLTSDTSQTGAPYNPSVTFGNDGTTLLANDVGGFDAGTNWGTPTTSGIGSGYWIKMNLGSGAMAITGSATGSWLDMTSNRTWTGTAVSGTTRLRNMSYQIATDAAGSNIVGSGSVLLTCTG